jgi:hypothetical protein
MSHPLDGCRAKIERAKEHIRNLDADISRYINEAGHTVTFSDHYDPSGGAFDRRMVINGPAIPARIMVIVGEIVHQLRSSLDHLVWQLVLANKTAAVTPDLEFPVFWERTKYPTAAKRKIKGISSGAVDLIERPSAVPCHWGR